MKRRDKRTQETIALLKILALGDRQIKEGKVVPAAEAFRRVRLRSAKRLPRSAVSLSAETYSDKRVREFDAGEADLNKLLRGKKKPGC